MLKAGDCIHIETEINGKIIGHLFIVLFNGEEHTSYTIIVPIDTFRSDKQDKTVMLRVGDHDFIKSVSFVNYRFAKVSSLIHLNKLIEAETAKIKQPVKEDILALVREGVRKSKHTPNDVLISYSNHMFRELNRKS